MARFGVGEHHRVLAVSVLEEIIDRRYCSISRQTKLKSVSRYWTQYSSVGGEPVVASRNSEKPRSENTFLMMAIGVICGKILQSEVRVSNHSQGLSTSW